MDFFNTRTIISESGTFDNLYAETYLINFISGPVTITGVQKQGNLGTSFRLNNLTGSDLTLIHNSSQSDIENRFYLPNNINLVLTDNNSIQISYSLELNGYFVEDYPSGTSDAGGGDTIYSANGTVSSTRVVTIPESIGSLNFKALNSTAGNLDFMIRSDFNAIYATSNSLDPSSFGNFFFTYANMNVALFAPNGPTVFSISPLDINFSVQQTTGLYNKETIRLIPGSVTIQHTENSDALGSVIEITSEGIKLIKKDGGSNTNMAYFTHTGTSILDLRNTPIIISDSVYSLLTSGFYIFTGLAGTTWTLPVVGDNVGVTYYIKNRGEGAITLESNGGGSDIFDLAASNNFIINQGEGVTIINDGTYWCII